MVSHLVPGSLGVQFLMHRVHFVEVVEDAYGTHELEELEERKVDGAQHSAQG